MNRGIQGAEFSTVLSQIFTTILTLSYYCLGNSNFKFAKSSLKLNKKLVLGIFAIVLALFSIQIVVSMVQVIYNHALKTYGGDLAIGAMTTISIMFLMPIFGINQDAQPIVGFNYGAKQYDRTKRLYLTSVTVATIMLCIAIFIIQTFLEIIIYSL